MMCKPVLKWVLKREKKGCLSVFCYLIIVLCIFSIFFLSISLLAHSDVFFLLSSVSSFSRANISWLLDLRRWFGFGVKVFCCIGVLIWAALEYKKLHNFMCSKSGQYTVGNTGREIWPRRAIKINRHCKLQYTWLCGQSYLRDEEGVRFALIKAFDYSALWLCVGGEGKSRHIQRGQAGQIPQEENVKTKAGTWRLRNPPCSSRCTQPNCCLETKQCSSLFFPPFISFWLLNLQFSLWFAVKRSGVELLRWIGLLIFRYVSRYSNNCALIVANTCPKNYWTKLLGVVGKGQCFCVSGRKEINKNKEKGEIERKSGS